MKVTNIELNDIDTTDYPDFCDAFIAFAEWDNGVALTDDELETLNEDSEFVYQCVMDRLF